MDVRGEPSSAEVSSTMRWRMWSRLDEDASSRLNSSSAVALSASRLADSYNRAFSTATAAWPASTSSRRMSSSSNWSSPSFETTMTPATPLP